MIVTPFTHEPTHKTVWDLRPNGNIFPGLTVWEVHKNGNVFLGLIVCDIHTNGNVFLGFTVGMYIPTEMIGFRCLAQSHTSSFGILGGPIPDDFWVVWEGHPITHTHLATVPNAVAERGFKPFV